MKRSAVYTRVSTSMQAEVEYNSCEAQSERRSGKTCFESTAPRHSG